MGRPGITAGEIVQGLGEPDLQDDVLDSQQPIGLEHEERQLSEEQQLEQLDVLEGLRAMQSADPIRWKVYRYGQSDEKFNGYQCELNTGSLTQETIRKLLGGGSFKVRGFFPNGKYAAQRSVMIAGEPILYVKAEERAAMQSPHQSGFNLAEFMTAQQRIDAQRRNEEVARAQEEEKRAERRSKENRDFMLAIGALVSPIIAAVVQRTAPATPQPDIAALVTALRKDTPTENPISGMKGMLEIMTMMRELMPDGGGGGSETVEMVKAVAGIAGPALQAFTQNRQPVPVRPRVQRPDPTQQPSRPPPVTIEATPVPTPIPKTAAPQVPGEQPTILQASSPSHQSGVDLSAPSQLMTPGEQSMFAQLKPQVDTLVQMARDGQDAIQVAEMFFDQFMSSAPDELYTQLCELFENPKTLDRMALFNKGVTELRPWFVTLQETVCHKIKQEEAQATAGSVENPATDG